MFSATQSDRYFACCKKIGVSEIPFLPGLQQFSIKPWIQPGINVWSFSYFIQQHWKSRRVHNADNSHHRRLRRTTWILLLGARWPVALSPACWMARLEWTSLWPAEPDDNISHWLLLWDLCLCGPLVLFPIAAHFSSAFIYFLLPTELNTFWLYGNRSCSEVILPMSCYPIAVTLF